MMLVQDVCATLRFSTADVPEPARAQAVRDLHLHERTILSARLEPIEPLEPLPDCPLHVDLTKRTLPGLAVGSGTLSGLRHAIRPSGEAANGEDDLLLGVNVRGCSTARQRDRDLMLRDGDAFVATRDESGFSITRPTPVRFVGCRVPREAVAPLVGRLDDTPLRLVPPRSEALTLLVTYRSYAYRFETPDRVIVFTGDTGPSDAVSELAKGADLLVTEASSFQERMKGMIDNGRWQAMTPAEQARIARQATRDITLEDIGKMATHANVKTVVLSRLTARVDGTDDYTPWAEEVNKYFSGQVRVAKDLMEFRLAYRITD